MEALDTWKEGPRRSGRRPRCSRRAMLVGTAAWAGFIATASAHSVGHDTAPLGGDASIISVSGAHNAPIPIGIPPFQGHNGASLQIAKRIRKVVAEDLNGCGLFHVRGKSLPQKEGHSNPVPEWAIWAARGVDALVSALVTCGKDRHLSVAYRLWSVAEQKQLRGVEYRTDQENWRRLAHIIADNIYEQLIGQPGYFNTRVAYVAVQGTATHQHRRLAVMDYDGHDVQYLTSGRWMALSPQWNPHRQQVAFVSYENNHPRVMLLDLQSGARTIVGDFGAMTFGPRFSPDGRSLLFSVTGEFGAAIVRYDLDTRRLTRLTDADSINVTPCYNPDGTKIVFNSDRDGPGNQQLFVMKADGSNVQRISYGSGRYAEPDWSPDGRLIAFTRLTATEFGIGVMRPDGLGERLLTQGYLVQTPSFCPNGRVIMYCRQQPQKQGMRSRLMMIGADGYNGRAISDTGDATDPAWGPILPL